ncbi:MAG: PP2C family protein-serine/threonine phosphatase [Parahaliea sp.]
MTAPVGGMQPAPLTEAGPLRADDIAAARDIQMSILPPEMPAPPGYDLYGCLHPAQETGGDMFDLVALEQGIFVLLGDATGHGFGPALCATQMQAMFRVAFRVGAELEDAYIHVNNQLDEDLPDDRFVTAFAGFLDPLSHRLSYFSAGQGPILHFHAASGDCEWFGPTTFPLGTVAVHSPARTRQLVLAPGDIVAVLSDGIYEYEGGEGIFGRQRVGRLVAEGAVVPMSELAALLMSSLREFARGSEQQDDLTIVLLKREPD